MIKQFREVEENALFTLNGSQYRKIPSVKVSCCKSINAQLVADENNKIQVNPLEEVEVDD